MSEQLHAEYMTMLADRPYSFLAHVSNLATSPRPDTSMGNIIDGLMAGQGPWLIVDRP